MAVVQNHFFRVIFFILVICCSPGFTGNMVSVHDSPALKAERLASFARYITWPEDYLGEHFIISIYGDRNFYEYLVFLFKERQIKNREVVVNFITSPTEMPGCHILFFSQSDSVHIQQFLGYLQDSPVLTIADTGCDPCEGLVITLSGSGETFSFNLGASARARLNVSSRLLEVAEKVY